MRKILVVLLLLAQSFSYSAKAEAFSFPTIAIIDTGINSSLEIFKDRILHEVCLINFDPVYNSCPNESNIMEGPGAASLPLEVISKNGFDHGTQISSVAVKRNLTVKIVFIRIIGYNKDGSRQVSGEASINNALDWVYKNKEKYNIQAVSMSQGHHNLGVAGTDYCPKTPITESKINELESLGVPTFFSVGNGRDYQRIDWPSCIPSSIAIGATMPEKSIAIYSNFDPNLVDFFALGTHRAFNPDGTIKNIAGTSASAVVAATIWATVKNNRPNLNYSQIYTIFSKTSITTSNSKVTGGKLIDFERAFDADEFGNTTSPAPTEPAPITTKKPATVDPTISSDRASTVANSALPNCSGTQKAQLTQITASNFKLSSSMASQNDQYQITKSRYTNAMLSGDQISTQRLKLDLESIQIRINNLNRQFQQNDAKTKSITSKCNPEGGLKSGANTKKLNCTSGVIFQLEDIREDYYSYMDHVLEIQAYIKKAKFDYQNALSWGQMNEAAQMQINIRDANIEGQKSSIQADLLQKQFNELNSSCKNSGVNL